MVVAVTTIDKLLRFKPESLEDLTAHITPDIYIELRGAVELRKFADGSRLSPEQLENCLQLVILYEGKNLPEHQRTGFDFPTSCKTQQGQAQRGKTQKPKNQQGESRQQAGSSQVQFWSKG